MSALKQVISNEIAANITANNKYIRTYRTANCTTEVFEKPDSETFEIIREDHGSIYFSGLNWENVKTTKNLNSSISSL